MSVLTYSVIAKRDPTAFATAVQASIDGGSQPFGAPFLDSNNGCITQAMITGSQVLVGATGSTGATGATDATGVTVRHAAGVPSGAPTGSELPVALDSTAVTGGVYVWTGAAWVKGATI